jgi:hypothetical protein
MENNKNPNKDVKIRPTRKKKSEMLTDELIETRKKLLMKGYVNRSEIRKFVPCSQQKSNEIFQSIRKKSKLSGYENLDENIILTEKLAEFMGLDITPYKEK